MSLLFEDGCFLSGDIVAAVVPDVSAQVVVVALTGGTSGTGAPEISNQSNISHPSIPIWNRWIFNIVKITGISASPTKAEVLLSRMGGVSVSRGLESRSAAVTGGLRMTVTDQGGTRCRARRM